MTKQLETRTPRDMATLAYGMLFTALMAVQLGMVNTAIVHPETPIVVND